MKVKIGTFDFNVTQVSILDMDTPESVNSATLADSSAAKPESAKWETDGEIMTMSETVQELEDMFNLLNSLYFSGRLSKPVLTVQTTPKAYGHCSVGSIWQSATEEQREINLGAEHIDRPKAEVCATLLHEMVHLYCRENEIQETSQKGKFHNKKFKEECEARELHVEYDKRIGWSRTSATQAFTDRLAAAGVDLKKPFAKFARQPESAKIKKERKPLRKYICPCCGQTVKSTKELRISCEVCNLTMEDENEQSI